MQDNDKQVPVARAIADLLVASGVKRVYTVPGESFLPLMESFDETPGLQLISARHEGGAAFMAEADAKLTGQPAVVMATRGVGAANLSIGLHTARQDSSPVLAFLGQVSTEHLGNEAFQEVDLPKFLAEVSKWGVTVHRSDRGAELVAQAINKAVQGRPGPAVVAFPEDQLHGDCQPQPPFIRHLSVGEVSAQEVQDVVNLLTSAQQPAIIAGQGADHGLLQELSQLFGLGVFSAFRRQDSFPNDDPHYLGHLTLGTHPEIRKSLMSADVVLVLGERIDETTAQAYAWPNPGTKVVHVHSDVSVLGSVVHTDTAIVADPTKFVAQLIAHGRGLENFTPSTWWQQANQVHREVSSQTALPDPSGGLHPGMVISEVYRQAEKDAIVTNDAGNFSVYLHRIWSFNAPHTQAAPISGAMGYAVPAAVGAQLAFPQRQVFGVAGDGGFLMTGGELETAARLQLPVKIMVFQNGLYGTIAMHQARGGYPLSAHEISDVDLVQYAQGLGAHAIQITSPDEIAEKTREFIEYSGPVVLVTKTDSDLIVPGQTLSGIMEQHHEN